MRMFVVVGYLVLVMTLSAESLKINIQSFGIKRNPNNNHTQSTNLKVRSSIECASLCAYETQCCLSVYDPHSHSCRLSATINPWLDIVNPAGIMLVKNQDCQIKERTHNGTLVLNNYPFLSHELSTSCLGMICPFPRLCTCNGKWMEPVCVTEGVYSSPNVSQPDLGFYPYYQVTFQSSTYLFSYQTMTFYEAEDACTSIGATLIEIDDRLEHEFIRCVTETIVHNPPKISVQSFLLLFGGQTGTLSCDVESASAIIDVYWQRTTGYTTKTIRFDTDLNKYSGASKIDHYLTIFNADSNDSGVYFCFVTNSGGTSQSEGTVLGVTTLTAPKLSYFANSGQTITLECHVSSVSIDIIYWQKISGGVLTFISSTTNVFKFSGATVFSPSLTIINVDKNDSGEYTCMATNGIIALQSSTITLSVDGITTTSTIKSTYQYSTHDQATENAMTATTPSNLPKVFITYNSYSTITNSAVTLACSVSSNVSFLEVYWKRNVNGSITTIDNVEGFHSSVQTNMYSETTETYIRPASVPLPSKYYGATSGNPSLTIVNVVSADAGEYTCYARNGFGTSQSESITLIVITPAYSWWIGLEVKQIFDVPRWQSGKLLSFARYPDLFLSYMTNEFGSCGALHYSDLKMLQKTACNSSNRFVCVKNGN